MVPIKNLLGQYKIGNASHTSVPLLLLNLCWEIQNQNEMLKKLTTFAGLRFPIEYAIVVIVLWSMSATKFVIRIVRTRNKRNTRNNYCRVKIPS